MTVTLIVIAEAPAHVGLYFFTSEKVDMNVMMKSIFTLGASVLFLATASAADYEHERDYQSAMSRADSDYSAAKRGCTERHGHDRDVCLKDAKAEYVHATADAKAQRESAAARASARDEKRDASYVASKERCDALTGERKDTCIHDATGKYHP